MTWNPCNPVSIKNTLPYNPSLIVNFVKPYSKNCNQENKTPKEIATYIVLITNHLYPAKIERCAAVIATPEQSNTTVFTKGSINGFNTSKSLIPTGGQTAPNAIDGDKLPWKNAQKNGKNNIASDTKNKTIPYFNAAWTRAVWLPSFVDSRNKLYVQAHMVNDININSMTITVLIDKWFKFEIKKNGSNTCDKINPISNEVL